MRTHWEKVYSSKETSALSWFQKRAERSLAKITEAKISLDASILDVGGGASPLAGNLLEIGYQNISILDISGSALATAQMALGLKAKDVHWIESDILTVDFPANAYDVWHDRAVFHFLEKPEDRQTYVRVLLRALKPGGLVVMATFSEEGPMQCSGLPVVRYSPEKLHAELGASFVFLESEEESHFTPAGAFQKFLYCVFQKLPINSIECRAG
ncbi:SAM-dependent methyltransferase [Gammaproteobacteria bacterium]